MCDEYAISPDYVVLKKDELKRDYIPKSKIREMITRNEKKISSIPRYDLGRADYDLEIEIKLLENLLGEDKK